MFAETPPQRCVKVADSVEPAPTKRAAARVLVRELLGEDGFEGQKWGYVIAYESDIRASESWEDLKRKSNPGA